MTALIGVAEHYAQFVKLARLRIADLGVTYDTVDAICGFPARYTATLLSGGKAMSIYSFFTLARGLALMPSFAHDETQLVTLCAREDWIKLRRPGPRLRGKGGGVTRIVLNREFYRQIGRKGAAKRSMLQKQRRAQTWAARQARWGGK